MIPDNIKWGDFDVKFSSSSTRGDVEIDEWDFANDPPWMYAEDDDVYIVVTDWWGENSLSIGVRLQDIVTGWIDIIEERHGSNDYCDNEAGAMAEGKLIAAPPEIPFGTWIDITGYGYAEVLDRGGVIKGRRLDLLFPTHQEALNWGVEYLEIRL